MSGRSTTGPGCGSPRSEIAEAFAATRGLTMPSQLRRMIREQGRDLHAEFTRLLPERIAADPHPALDGPPGRALLVGVVGSPSSASQLLVALLRSPL